jgi:hypothetical protein
MLRAQIAEVGNKVPVHTRFGRRGWHTHSWQAQNQSVAPKRENSHAAAAARETNAVGNKAARLDGFGVDATAECAHPAAARRDRPMPTSAKLNSELYHTVRTRRPKVPNPPGSCGRAPEVVPLAVREYLTHLPAAARRERAGWKRD